MTSSTPFADLAPSVSELEELSKTALLVHWKTVLKQKPPAHVSRALLVQALAYRLQERTCGKLKPKTLRKLYASARDAADKTEPASGNPVAQLHPGVCLMREWQGTMHQITVTETGFVWRGESFRSLSAVARKITGARWSGPRFFGLKKKGAA